MADDGSGHSHRAHADGARCLLGEGVILFVFLLHFEGDGYAVGKFEVWVTVFDQFPISEKSEVADAKDVGPSFLCLGDLEVLARTHGKENSNCGELSDGTLQLSGASLSNFGNDTQGDGFLLFLFRIVVDVQSKLSL